MAIVLFSSMKSLHLWNCGLLVCLLIAFGCSKAKGPASAPVRGQVSYQGKPVAEAMVIFHRIGGDVEGNQKPMAYTDASGAFALTTFHQHDGAPPGDYAITVELRAPQMVGEETVRSGRNLLPAKYAKPATSGLKFTVADSDNHVPPIELK